MRAERLILTQVRMKSAARLHEATSPTVMRPALFSKSARKVSVIKGRPGFDLLLVDLLDGA
jgi:hypothetical protein